MKNFVTRILLLITISSTLLSQDKEKIGLVLSGGGIKGFGHLGTLHMIDSLNIPIDYVVGTSIGAISAALYATGHSPYEIDKIGSETNWNEIFGQTRARNQLLYFQKKDNSKFQLTFSLIGFTPTTPISLSNGQYSYEHLLDLFSEYSNMQNYDDFIIPFRCNATDIISGDEIIFNSGSLAKSLRISTSIPTVFSPIEYNDKLLVDGGLINNLPTNLAESLGAEYIIASNVMSYNKSKADLVDMFNIIEKLIELYGEKSKKINSLNADILISPKINDMNIINFNIKDINKMKLEGKKAAYENLDKFLKLENNKNNFINISTIQDSIIKIDSLVLSEDMKTDFLIHEMFKKKNELSKDEITEIILTIRSWKKYYNIYTKYILNDYSQTYDLYIYGKKNKPIFINQIEVKGNNKISKNEILSMFSINKNEQINISILNSEIKKAYQTERFEYINYDFIGNNNSTLVLNVKEAKSKKLKLGVIWDNHYKLIGKIKLDIFNKPFKKFRLQNELLFSGIKKNKLTLYYMFNQNNKTNLIPFIEFTNLIKNIEIYNNNTINNIEHDFNEFSYGIIYPISKFGSILISYNKFDSEYKFNLPFSNMNYTNNNIYYKNLNINIDQINDILHPRGGYRINLSYKKSSQNVKTQYNNSTDTSNDYEYLKLKFNYYKTFNYNHTIRLFNQYKKSSTVIPLYLMSEDGGIEWSVGYDEFALTSKQLNLFGCEYQYHFKNNITYRFILNKVTKINSYTDTPTNWGFGIKVKSLLGPINFTWSKGHFIPFDKNSKEINIFYFNFGVAL